ncbi:MAG TPA: glycosyltransferase family 2 protein [Thermoplasmata archaeon]|nr:glycosyltransferase family 2 protein [Thermoplasmata archaeon]
MTDHEDGERTGGPATQKPERFLLVVVVNWKGGENTIQCIESLLSQTTIGFELLVVDNGSSDAELVTLKGKFRDAIEIARLSVNLGFPAACNRAFVRAMEEKYRYVMLVNNDARLDPRAVNALVKTAEVDETIGAVVPKVYYWHRPSVIQCAGGRISLALGMTIHYGINSTDTGEYDRVCDVEFAEASVCVYRVEALRQVGLFDENLFAYWEDADLSMRLHRGRFRIVYCPVAKVWHKVSQSAPPHTKTFLFIRNALIFANRYCSGVRILSALLSILGIQTPILMLQSLDRAESAREKHQVLLAPLLAILWHVNPSRVSDSFWKPV